MSERTKEMWQSERGLRLAKKLAQWHKSRKGWRHSDVAKIRMSEAQKNRPPMTDQTKKKLSESLKIYFASLPPRTQKPKPPKRHPGCPLKKAIAYGIEYESVSHAASAIGVDRATIRNRIANGQYALKPLPQSDSANRPAGT